MSSEQCEPQELKATRDLPLFQGLVSTSSEASFIMSATFTYDPVEIEAVSLRMLELRLYRVKHFKAILSNKTCNAVETATVLVPDNHHENVRGQAYYE